MRASSVKYSVLTVALTLASVMLVLLPYHALLTVWAGSNFGHYTLFRLWPEFVSLLAGLCVIWLFIFDRKLRAHTLRHALSWLIVGYILLDIAVGLVASAHHQVSLKALAYGILDDLRFLVFFVICWAIAIRTDRFNRRWYKLALWPAVLVAVFGVLQLLVLPANFLVHFGYGPKTILPYETINHNQHYVRIFSTLRGANPLGTYLILPISVLLVSLVYRLNSWTWSKFLLLAALIITLYGSFSRAAWIGVCLSSLVITVVAVPWRRLLAHRRIVWPAVGLLVVICLGVGLAIGHSSRLQNIILHTQSHSASKVSSDQAHLSALTAGFSDMVKHPLGEGPGTSGPASVYNHDRPALIAEDYFLQVGDESGWLGLVLFLAICSLISYSLYMRRSSPFALALLAAFIGISFTNLFSLAWTDDTISFLWWGLAGVALALPRNKTENTDTMPLASDKATITP